MHTKIDVIDGLAAVLYAQAGIFDILLGGWLLFSVILAYLGVILLLLGLGALWVFRGIVERNGEVWWVGVVLAALSLVTPVFPVPNLTPFLPNWVGALIGFAALAYFVARRKRFGVTVRRTSGYEHSRSGGDAR